MNHEYEHHFVVYTHSQDEYSVKSGRGATPLEGWQNMMSGLSLFETYDVWVLRPAETKNEWHYFGTYTARVMWDQV